MNYLLSWFQTVPREKVPIIGIIRTVKSNVSAVFQKSVENMELFAYKIRTFKGEPQK